MKRRRLVAPSEEVQDRFWSKVAIAEEGEDRCWLWKAATRPSDSTGVFGIDGVIYYVHRIAYVITRGEIPEGKDVRRSCSNSLCVRPLHLTLSDSNSAE